MYRAFRRHWILLLTVALVAAACSASVDSSASEVTSEPTVPDIEAPNVEQRGEEETATVIPDTAPAIEGDGTVVFEQLESFRPTA